MGEALVVRYWCHMCSRMVSPVMMEVELKCPFCDGGFVEEMDGRGAELDAAAAAVAAVDIGSDRALSLWAPILLGMMDGPSRRRRFQREEEDEDPQQDRDLMSLLRRRRRSSAIFQLLQSLEDGIQADNPDGERERERVILINPFRQAVILGTSSGSVGEGSGGGSAPLGDYYVGAGLDLLLQHLAENDPNKYGTPPARREAVDALPTVKVEGGMSCSVCLEDLEDGAEAREMPCKHRFHNGCIVQWLELHSSCPICRFQLPADESKNSGGGGGGSERADDVGDGGVNGRRFWVPVPWPFNGLFSFSGSQSGGGSGSSSSSAAPPPNDSHGNEN